MEDVKPKKKWTKKNVSIYLEPEDIAALDNIARSKRTSRNKLIEFIIAKYAEDLNNERIN